MSPLRSLLEQHRDKTLLPSAAAIESPLVSYCVNVTNTGSLDADDVVLGFVTPPGAGSEGVPLKSLFGFERVHVPAGETVTVWLYPAATEHSQVDHTGVRRASAGKYLFQFGLRETATRGMGYVEHAIEMV